MGRGAARDAAADSGPHSSSKLVGDERGAGRLRLPSDDSELDSVDINLSPKGKPSGSDVNVGNSSPLPHSTEKAFHAVVSSWFSKKFASGCVVLFPLCITVYLCWWFLAFFDHFFSPIFKVLFGFQVFGLGFITSMVFIFFTGVFVSSWLGTWFLWLGEWVIDKLPIIGHVYSATKQISSAVNPAAENTAAFRECVIIRHPRRGEYAFAFITGQCTLHGEDGDQELFSVFIPTNHIYVGDIVMLGASEIIKPNLTVREGLEIVVSCGCALPPHLTGASGSPSGTRSSWSAGTTTAGGGGGGHAGVYGISSAPLGGDRGGGGFALLGGGSGGGALKLAADHLALQDRSK